MMVVFDFDCYLHVETKTNEGVVHLLISPRGEKNFNGLTLNS